MFYLLLASLRGNFGLQPSLVATVNQLRQFLSLFFQVNHEYNVMLSILIKGTMPITWLHCICTTETSHKLLDCLDNLDC